MTTIDELYRQALGVAAPFEYQRRLASEGLPEVLEVPTGCGKTPAVMLAWLYRRLLHIDSEVRRATATRLIWCLPLRSLTTQTARLAGEWVARAGLADQVDVHVLMGGEPVPDQQWRLDPQRPAVIVSTLDMALSRALNRGFLASRYAWPVDFALFNDDCHWVYDEVQLMGVALTTSRQLHGLRSALGVPSRHSSTWMSATLDRPAMLTVDAPFLGKAVALDERDRLDPGLARRLGASKTFVRRRLDNPKSFAAEVASVARAEHVSGTTTLVVVNTVDTACEVARLLRRTPTTDDAPVELLHSRFRRPDRDAALRRVQESQGEGRVVVSTQVIEAGVDLSARTLVTECAVWSSLVQRAGRCNRWGEADGARVIVLESAGQHAKRGPYDPAALERAWDAAGQLDGSVVTPDSLAAVRVDDPTAPALTLRRKDLLELFDTAPDLGGNDIDVSRFIRADGDLDIAIAWRAILGSDGRVDVDAVGPKTAPAERCPVTISAARAWFKAVEGRAVVYDALERAWRLARLDDLRPGTELVVDVGCGGYSASTGFDPRSRGPVEPLTAATVVVPTLDDDRDVGDDPLTTESAVPAAPLDVHLLDAERAARRLCDELGVADDLLVRTVCRSARLHDLGKAQRPARGLQRRARLVSRED